MIASTILLLIALKQLPVQARAINCFQVLSILVCQSSYSCIRLSLEWETCKTDFNEVGKCVTAYPWEKPPVWAPIR